MNALQSNAIASALVDQAQALGPRDPLTLAAHSLGTFLRLALFPTLLLIPPVTSVLSIMVILTFGGLLLLLSAIWLAFFGLLLGSSWMWLKVPILRPLLIIPGVLISVAVGIFVSLVPDMGEKFQKVIKMALCDSWPYSYLVFKLSRMVEVEDCFPTTG